MLELKNDDDLKLDQKANYCSNIKLYNDIFCFIFYKLKVLLEVGCFLIPYICGEKNENCSTLNGFDLVVYIHSCYWLLKYGFDRFYQFHHMKSRRLGYLEFYRVTRTIRSLPLLIISAGNSLLVILIKLLAKYCPDKCTAENLTPNNFLQIFISLENCLLLPIMIYYLGLFSLLYKYFCYFKIKNYFIYMFLVQTLKFNREKKTPDINNELQRPLFQSSDLKNIGFKDSSYLSNILENQADMIRYLQERNEKLSKKLYLKNDKTNVSTITNIN